MEIRPDAEGIQKIVQAAHIIAPAFTEEQLEMLFEVEEDLARSGFVETAWSLLQLEQEKGVTLEQTQEYFEELLGKVQDLEKAVARLGQEHDAWQQQIKVDVQAAAKARQERHQAEKKLAAFRTQADQERKRVAADLARARQEAEVSLEEVAEAGELKAEVKNRGLTVVFLLDLCRGLELAPEAPQRLAREIQENGTLALANVSKTRELEATQALVAQSKENVARLEKQRHEEEAHLAKLREDKAWEETVHRFYRRFSGLGALTAYVASWDRVAFFRCNHPLCAARFWVDREASALHLRSRLVCPGCGGENLAWDSQAYGAVGYAGGWGFIKLNLGE